MKLEWLVPVIVIIVYAIGWIIKAKEEIDAKANKPVGKAPGKELDRFLQEIDRLRKQQESAPTAKASRDDDDEQPEPVIVRPVVRPVQPVPQRAVVPRARPVPATPSPVFAVTQPEDRPRPGTPLTRAGKATSAPAPVIPRHSTINGVLALLRNPRTVSTALVLNEILGPPRSKRN